MAPSEMVQASEVQIYERTLYKVAGCTFPGGICRSTDLSTPFGALSSS